MENELRISFLRDNQMIGTGNFSFRAWTRSRISRSTT